MALELRGITKEFPTVLANDDVSLSVDAGEIVALLGENGAGKTTLMNVLFGLYSPDSGEVVIDGAELELANPRASIQAGVGMVHQHFMLVPVFTVAENVILGMEPLKGVDWIDRKAADSMIREVSDRYNLSVNPEAMVEDIPVGVQQRVEIIKVLVRDARYI
ncbi:MAG: ATP-binding cassette domain-containing protein, partial [Acidimicrobiia bacterium]